MNRQQRHYAALVTGRRPSRGFSCGYYERFDPFLLDRKPFLRAAYETAFAIGFPRRLHTIVDLGCGTGLYWPVLRQFCDRIIGVDASPEMASEAARLIAAKALTGVEVHVAPLEDPGLPAASADGLLCMDALHHVEDVAAAVAQIARIAAPGARVCVIEPNIANPLMFLAHLLPGEERRALTRNFPPLLRGVFGEEFASIRTQYVNFVASAATPRQAACVARADRLVRQVPWLQPLALRQIVTMQRR